VGLKENGLDPLEVGFGGIEFREETLFGLELAGVDAAATGFHSDGMLEVEHLVVEEVLDRAARSVWAIEDAADDDCVVSGIIVAEHAARVVSAPGECGSAEKAMKEAGVERLEDFVEIVVVARGCGEAFAPAGLADVLGLPRDGLGGDMAAVAVGMQARDGLLVELGQEDVGDGVVNSFGRRLEKVGEADVEASFAKTDGGVERSEAPEADVECGNGRSRTEFAVLLLEDGDEGGWCRMFFRARLFGFWWLQRWRRHLVKEAGGWCRRRRKELQKLPQR
jgi:hypothetical protein